MKNIETIKAIKRSSKYYFNNMGMACTTRIIPNKKAKKLEKINRKEIYG